MLAVCKYMTPSNVHMLLGAEIFFDIGKYNEIRSSLKSLIIQDNVCCCKTNGFAETPKQTFRFVGFLQFITVKSI